MGFWGNLFGRLRADPAQQVRWMLPYPVSGLNLSPDEALQVSAVWACIDVIAKAVASCDWNLYRPTGPGRREQLTNDPVTYLLNTRPNPDMTAIALRESLLYIAIPFGNAYAEIVPTNGGTRPAEIWPLEAERVTPRRDPQTNALYYEYREIDGTPKRLEQAQVFHLRGPSITGLVGDNLVARAVKSISVAAAAERYSASFFGRGAQPSGVLEYPGKLTKEQYDRMKEDWAEKKQGPENAHRPMILEGGMKWNTTSVDPAKSQSIESRQFSVEEICRWFGVPPHKIQHLLRATFSNIEHLSIEFVRDALKPWCKRLTQEADYKLFPQKQAGARLYTEIDTAPLTYGDAVSRAAAHAVWRQNGIMSANEIRAREGLNDAGNDGDVLLVQSNLTTVEKILSGPAPGAAGTRPSTEPEDEPADTAAAEVADQALGVILAGALERYARRLSNRRADLTKRLEAAAVEDHLRAERARLLPGLVDEVQESGRAIAMVARKQNLTTSQVLSAAELVDRGEPPQAAAAKTLSTTRATVSA